MTLVHFDHRELYNAAGIATYICGIREHNSSTPLSAIIDANYIAGASRIGHNNLPEWGFRLGRDIADFAAHSHMVALPHDATTKAPQSVYPATTQQPVMCRHSLCRADQRQSEAHSSLGCRRLTARTHKLNKFGKGMPRQSALCV